MEEKQELLPRPTKPTRATKSIRASRPTKANETHQVQQTHQQIGIDRLAEVGRQVYRWVSTAY